MKQHFLFQSLFIGLLLTLLWGCSDETITSVTDSEKQSERLTVIVTDGGYIASAGEDPLTRTKEEDYKTTFTAGDKIGLYAVKNNAIITGCNNVCLTLAADGKWTPPTGTEIFYEGADATCYAYYPYQPLLAGALVPSATDADGFFANVVAQWTPATDQGNYAKYTASDLMTGKGTVSGTPGSTHTLSFTFTHRMALMVMDLPKAKYALSTDANYTWLADALDTEFNGFSPYHLDAGLYRYLIKPSQTNLFLSGSYTNASSTTNEWGITPTIAPGNYKSFKVDNGNTVNNVTHTLAVGDFYMKNGALVAKNKAELTEEEQTNCIGIVYKVGAGNGDSLSDYGGKLTTIHGYVLALQQSWQVWGDASRIFVTGDGGSHFGYKGTQILLTAAATESKSFPACMYCVNYKPATPTGITSGWYYPATAQMRECAINANSNGMNTQLAKISGAASLSGTYSSCSDVSASQCWGARVGNGSYFYLGKGSNLTRAVFTF
nr:fimbrillin family protein [uncultured Bacteroides sp.]